MRAEKAKLKEQSWDQKHQRKAKPQGFDERLAEYEARQRQLDKKDQVRRMQRLH